MKLNRYEDKYFYYFRKPCEIPSTYGKEKCFLDYLIESDDKDIKAIVESQKEYFSQQDEYGLVNRLDNDTTGLLYLAKTPLFKEKYKQAQKDWKVEKYYIADVYGKFSENEKTISYQITHHKFSSDRMVVILGTEQTGKIDTKRIQNAKTNIQFIYYDEKTNISTLLIKISKWVRHQIRAHLSSIWFPIVWEKIYIKNPSKEDLHLYSVWLKIDNFL